MSNINISEVIKKHTENYNNDVTRAYQVCKEYKSLLENSVRAYTEVDSFIKKIENEEKISMKEAVEKIQLLNRVIISGEQNLHDLYLYNRKEILAEIEKEDILVRVTREIIAGAHYLKGKIDENVRRKAKLSGENMFPYYYILAYIYNPLNSTFKEEAKKAIKKYNINIQEEKNKEIDNIRKARWLEEALNKEQPKEIKF